MALASQIPGEEYYRVAIGQGMYTAELPSNIPDGYASICYNTVASGDSIENRIGIKNFSYAWKVMENTPAASNFNVSPSSDDLYYFCQVDPWGRTADKIAFGWGSYGYAVPAETPLSPTLHLVRSVGGTGDGVMAVTLPQEFLGMCDYNGTVYFSMRGAGVQKITNVNWTADTITYSAIASSATGTLRGLFTFKDRLWGYNNNKLYFTDLPTSPGGAPETWAFAANVIVINPPNGSGSIRNVVALGNKLAIFTTNGFFTLLVEGAPAGWILRVLDSRSISTSGQCGFESKGIIYYVNTQGVWATNNLTTTKLSAVIEDQWFLAKGTRIHSLVPYEDGMIVSIGKITTTDANCFDKDNCRIFYSKLDPIGWSEWNVNRYDMGNDPYQFAMIWSTTDKIPTFLNPEPTVYLISMVTDSTEAVKTKAVFQVQIFDGGTDQWWKRDNTASSLPVGLFVKTKRFDGGNPYNIKRAKRGMFEIFTSDDEHNFYTSWDIDETVDEASEVRKRLLNDFVVGYGSNLIQIQNSFYYRRLAINIRSELQSDTSQIKIKDVAIAQDTGRAEFEQVR